jgi:hypothetical protein
LVDPWSISLFCAGMEVMNDEDIDDCSNSRRSVSFDWW